MYSSDEMASSDAALTDTPCYYEFDPHKSGSYTLVVSAPGFQMVVGPTVNLQFDECGAVENAQTVTIMLSP